MGVSHSDRIGAATPLGGISKTLSVSPLRVVSESGWVSVCGRLHESVCAFAPRRNKIRAEGPSCDSPA